MHTCFKAVRPDGTDFFTGTVQWAPPEGHEGEWIVRHPTATEIGTNANSYLSVSTVPTDCLGMEWPCRLFEVAPVGDVETAFCPKVAGLAFRVVRELDSHIALGPQGEYVAALIERIGRLTDAEADQLDAAEGAAAFAAWDAAADAAWDAAVGGARGPTWDVAWALLVRDLISTEHYDVLTRSWRTVIGPIHPGDAGIQP